MIPIISPDTSTDPGSLHPDSDGNAAIYQKIRTDCEVFLTKETRGQLGMAIASIAHQEYA